jgi:predicted HAD superfamily Cof-like phosphohydrolase
MNRLQSQVREFHRTVLKQPHSPAAPELRTANLRARLIAEEAIETICGLVGGAQAQNIIHELIVQVLNQRAKKGKSGADLVEALDGLCDLAVVTYGTAEAIGVDLDPFTDEVMRSNMDKVGGPVDEHGKQGKPPGWRDADIKGVLTSMQCDECDGSGAYFIDGAPQKCICSEPQT